MSIRGSFNSIGSFKSADPATYRTWLRYRSPVFENTADRQQKLKYYVLKNPPNTTVLNAPSRFVVSENATNIITLFGKRYLIPLEIYDALMASLAVTPVNSFTELQQRIKEVRLATGQPAPINVQLKDVPLNGFQRQYTYPGAGDKVANISSDITSPSKNPGPDYKIYGYLFNAFNNLPPAVLTALLNSFDTLLVKIQAVYGDQNLKFRLQKGYFISVQTNNYCSYVTTVAELFTVASRAGLHILALPSPQDYPFDSLTGDDAFRPILARVVPYSQVNAKYVDTIGVIFGVNDMFIDGLRAPPLGPFTDAVKDQLKAIVHENSEIIFIPMVNDVSYMESIDYPTGTGVRFPVTNGGFFTQFYNLAPDN